MPDTWMTPLLGLADIALDIENCEVLNMADSIYAFKGEGIAWQALNYRQGARHTLMVFTRAQSIADAEMLANQIATDNGWLHVDLHNGAEVIAQPCELEEQYLRNALEDAIQFGSSMVTYEKELPSDA